jgi:hypothetical protein
MIHSGNWRPAHRVEQPTGPAWSAKQTGTLLPVRLHPDAVVPAEFTDFTPFDLSGWRGGSDPELGRLIESCRRLVARRGYRLQSGTRLEDESYQLGQARGATATLQSLTGKIATIGELLLDDNPAAADLNSALDEIGKTYRAVNDAVEDFLSAAAGGGPAGQLDVSTYLRLARGNLRDKIHNGRGSCTRIATLYGKSGGIRESILHRTDPELLHSIDLAFQQLKNADGDLFVEMEELGGVLTDEARYIANLALADQGDIARQRMIDAWRRLEPVESELQTARDALQEIQIQLGYVETITSAAGVSVTVQNVSINNSTVNAPIVVAHEIQGSWNTVADSTAGEDLKATLADLHAAVAAMTKALEPADAELAAGDLTMLTEEAVSAKPRTAQWRRAVGGLLDAAKRVGEVGIPVVELVAKVAALVGLS